MEVKLNNGAMEVRIDSLGAELRGLKDLKSGREYIWQRDPKFWGKSSPVLFPFVGVLKDGRYFYNGKEYSIKTRHGFARDNEFELVKKEDTCAEFLFHSNEKTREVYPFDFKLYLKYRLEGKKLVIEYRVENLEDEKMYFSLGAHPAFSTPLEGDSKYEDYYILMDQQESGELTVLDGALVDASKKVMGFDGKKIVLDRDRFKNDAMIIENPRSTKAYLRNDRTGYSLLFDFTDFKYIAFWNVPGAQFVCFEPWNGISDYDNCSGNLVEKKGIEVLGGKEKFVRRLEIEIL